MSSPIFTIGHSTHSGERFIALLASHGITALADVRSHPYSRRSPQFSRKALAAMLQHHGIVYAFLGRELGARREEEEVYDGDLARYERIARLDAFARGLQRVEKGGELFRVALMCAEKDPLTCHRGILVARHLVQHGHELRHIHEDGSIESTAELERRLLDAVGLTEADLFRPREDVVAEAYWLQGERIGYSRPTDIAAGRWPPMQRPGGHSV